MRYIAVLILLAGCFILFSNPEKPLSPTILPEGAAVREAVSTAPAGTADKGAPADQVLAGPKDLRAPEVVEVVSTPSAPASVPPVPKAEGPSGDLAKTAGAEAIEAGKHLVDAISDPGPEPERPLRLSPEQREEIRDNNEEVIRILSRLG